MYVVLLFLHSGAEGSRLPDLKLYKSLDSSVSIWGGGEIRIKMTQVICGNEVVDDMNL